MTPAMLAAPLVMLAAPAAAAAVPAPAAAASDPSSPASGETAIGAERSQPAPAPGLPVAADKRTASNVVFAEVLGSGLLYSVNYERLLEPWHIGLRAGASFFTHAVSTYGASGNLALVTFPLLASYYLGWRSHHLQLGLGATILYAKAATDTQGNAFGGERAGLGVSLSGVVGYRYLPRHGGISFGVGFTPLVRTSRFLPWGGADVGYMF